MVLRQYEASQHLSINFYTKTIITCDEDLAGQIYVGREKLKVRSIGHSAMLEEDAMHIGTETDVSGYVLDISERRLNCVNNWTQERY